MLTVSVVLLALASPAAPTREYSREDVQVKTDVADADLDVFFDVVAVARREADSLFDRLGVRKKSSRSIRVRLFAIEADFEDYRRRTFDQETKVQSISFYDDANREIAAAWQGGSALAQGELRGQVGRVMLIEHSKNAPPWLEEAVFGWLEGLEVDRFGDPIDRLNRRRLPQIRAAIDKKSYCPLFDLMDMREDQFYGIAGGPSDAKYPRSILYAESWSILYFLGTATDPRAQKLFKAAGERLDSGRWSQSQWESTLRELEPLWKVFLFDPAIETFGDSLRGAWTALERSDALGARMLAAEAVSLDYESVSAKRALAHAGLDCGDLQAAIVAFKELVELRPQDLDAVLGLARARFLRGKDKADSKEVAAAMSAVVEAAEKLAARDRWRAYVLAAEIAEYQGDNKVTLKYVREARKQKGIPAAVDARLAEQEDRLVRAVIK